MKIKGTVEVGDVIGALGLEKIPDGCVLKGSDTIDLDDIEVDDDVAYNALGIDDEDVQTFRDHFDQSDIIALAEAIRCGNRHEAELRLDRMFDSDELLTEWIQRGRYSRVARMAKAA